MRMRMKTVMMMVNIKRSLRMMPPRVTRLGVVDEEDEDERRR